MFWRVPYFACTPFAVTSTAGYLRAIHVGIA